MKTACLFAVLSLLLSVSATANFQNDNRQGFDQGNNNNNGKFVQGNRGSNKGASKSTSIAAGSASTATSTSPAIDGAPSVASATEGASTATSTSTAAGGASNASSTSTAAGGASNANSTSAVAGGASNANSTLTAAGGASTVNSTSAVAGGASNANSTLTAAGGASTVNSTSAVAGGASNANSTLTAAGGASNANSTSAVAGGASNANSSSTGAGATAGSADPQSSLTLANNVIATGFENNGQAVPTAGQIASLTSSNNFINFCLTVPNLAITNGKQISAGSCNPAPMGVIPSNTNMPSAKFVFPKNGDTSLLEGAPFTIQMAIQNLKSGAFVNANQNYFAAPQQVNANGQIIGHSHVVIEKLSALDQTTPTDPTTFAFFKGLNDAAVGGILTADVSAGLPAGFYKLSSINTAANHQPVLVPVAQHGSLDDAVYFTVNSNSSAAAAAPAALISPVVPASAQPTQAKKGKRFHPRALN